MQSDYARIWPYVIAGVAVLLIYRRFRRSFGPQLIRPVRMRIRIAVLVLLGCSLIPYALKSGQFLLAELAGMLAGLALGSWGAQHTRYANYAGRLHYVPHTVTGIAVSMLFIGRLVYRMVEWYAQGGMPGSTNAASEGMAPPMMRSPLTVGLIFVLVGYYLCYYATVLWKSKRISPEDLEAVPAPTAAQEAV